MSKVYSDKLAELEAVIRDYYVAQGYNFDSTCGFDIAIRTKYKYKALHIVLSDKEKTTVVFQVVKETTKEMFEEAIKHFKQLHIHISSFDVEDM